jgi:hypothetical protein
MVQMMYTNEKIKHVETVLWIGGQGMNKTILEIKYTYTYKRQTTLPKMKQGSFFMNLCGCKTLSTQHWEL